MTRGWLLAILTLGFLGGVLQPPAAAQDRPPGAGPAGKYLGASGARIYYEECGAGPPVVLLHDGLVHAIGWDGVWSTLCKKFHVVRYDRRGFGRSDPPGKPFLQTDDLAALLARRVCRGQPWSDAPRAPRSPSTSPSGSRRKSSSWC